ASTVPNRRIDKLVCSPSPLGPRSTVIVIVYGGARVRLRRRLLRRRPDLADLGADDHTYRDAQSDSEAHRVQTGSDKTAENRTDHETAGHPKGKDRIAWTGRRALGFHTCDVTHTGGHPQSSARTRVGAARRSRTRLDRAPACVPLLAAQRNAKSS